MRYNNFKVNKKSAEASVVDSDGEVIKTFARNLIIEIIADGVKCYRAIDDLSDAEIVTLAMGGEL
jgi:hypothetical protein